MTAWQSQWVKGILQKNARYSSGASNIGLLVKVIGKVRSPGSGLFYLDDNSGIDEGDPSKPGVRVNWPYAAQMPPDGSVIQLTAISSCTTVTVDSKQYFVRMLRPVASNAYTVIR